MAEPVEDTQLQEGADEGMDLSGSTTSTISLPLQPPDKEEVTEDVSNRGMGSEDVDDDDVVDLEKMAEDYAQYLVINSKQDTQQLDERIESVVFRVDEFKQQLSHMHQNITSSSDKMRQLHSRTQQLNDLFNRIDQVEAFLNIVGKNVDTLEDSISKAEKELDPSKLRKMFSAMPFRRSNKTESSPSWQPPKVFRARDYFTSTTPSPASPSPGQSSTF